MTTIPHWIDGATSVSTSGRTASVTDPATGGETARVSLASVAAGADAIMLEVHPDPENSAVDPLQPINFDAFDELMGSMEGIARVVGRTMGRQLP